MTVNPDLDRMLKHRATITATKTTWRHGHQVETASTAPQTEVKALIQAVSPDEIARAFGVEVVGDHWGFFNSTIEIEVGNQVIQTTGPSTGTLYWVKAKAGWNDPGGEHLDVALERATSGETLT